MEMEYYTDNIFFLIFGNDMKMSIIYQAKQIYL